jgi:hypothetical protein
MAMVAVAEVALEYTLSTHHLRSRGLNRWQLTKESRLENAAKCRGMVRFETVSKPFPISFHAGRFW